MKIGGNIDIIIFFDIYTPIFLGGINIFNRIYYLFTMHNQGSK